MDCSGVTTENSAICVCFLGIVFSCFGYSDCYSFVKYCRHWVGNQQTCCFRKLLQMCHCARCVPFWRMVNESCDCLYCRQWYRQSIVSDHWLRFCGCFMWDRFYVIVKCGKRMRPCVVSRTTLLFLIKCNLIIGPVNFLITTKCSTNLLSPVSNLSVAVANGFSNWPLATCIWKLGGSSILRLLFWAFYFVVSMSIWTIRRQMLLSPPGPLPLGYSQNPEAHRAFLFLFQDYCRS